MSANMIADAAEGLTKGLMSGLDELFTSDDERAAAALKVKTLLMQPQIIQAQTTLAEAANPNWFVSGWRPAIGWSCAAGIGWSFVIRPILQWLIYSVALVVTDHDQAMVAKQIADGVPDIDTATLIGLVTTLLGLGTIRMSEKLKGVARG